TSASQFTTLHNCLVDSYTEIEGTFGVTHFINTIYPKGIPSLSLNTNICNYETVNTLKYTVYNPTYVEIVGKGGFINNSDWQVLEENNIDGTISDIGPFGGLCCREGDRLYSTFFKDSTYFYMNNNMIKCAF